MKNKHIKYYLPVMAFIFSCLCFTSCEEQIDLDPIGNYDNIHGVYGAVKNVTGARDLNIITIFGDKTGSGQLYFELSKAATESVSVQFKIDEEALGEYNAANGTSYSLYPSSQVSFAGGGTISIPAGSKKSDIVDITVSSNGGVGQTYALPVSVDVTVGGAKVSAASSSYIYLVKPYAPMPDSDKGTGIKSVIYIEVNDENILNVGEYTMAGSGKPFFDVVNIFAANINYNANTGRAYVNCNENVAYILKNADQIIRPLQAKGVKVCLTILGNHDEAGVSNLSDEAAADFARELKSYVDVYGLDGIDFDDEWSTYNKMDNINDYVPSPGFVSPVGGGAAARLVYECRKLMPDKIISFYDWGNYVAAGSVDGVGVGTLLDYAYYGLYGNWSTSRMSSMTGMQKSQYGPIAFNLDYVYSEYGGSNRGGCNLSDAERLRNEGFGIQMFYNLKPLKYDYSTLFNQLGNTLFDDGVVWTGKTYSKTDTAGEAFVPSYESYLGNWTLTPAQGLFYYISEDGNSRWWDWTDRVRFNLRIEANVPGESYKVYGWGETEDDLPFIMNYNPYGRVEINLPQTVTDPGGGSWDYVARSSYSTAGSSVLTDGAAPALTGYINSSGRFEIRTLNVGYSRIRQMSPIQWSGGSTIDDIYGGGPLQDVAYQQYDPYVLTR